MRPRQTNKEHSWTGKEKEREQKNKEEMAYEDVQQKRRLPVNSVWLIVLGIVLTVAIVYVWTVGLFRMPN